MSKEANRRDALIGELAPVRDDELVGELRSPSAAALLVSIIDSPVDGRDRGRTAGRRVRVLVVAGVLSLAAALSFPAVGLVRQIAGLSSGADDVKPVPTAPAIVIASGEAGVPWKIVAVTSDHGLCLGPYTKDPGEGWVGNATCDYLDLRGDLPTDVRGNPSRPCLASPTEVVPCGSLPRHWIDFAYRTDSDPHFTGPGRDLTRIIVFGATAADVASVDLVLTNGESLRAHLVEPLEGLGAPVGFYWAALPLDDGYHRDGDGVAEPLKMVVARDAAGRVLERRVAAWNGNPTGDPDGPPPPQPLGE